MYSIVTILTAITGFSLIAIILMALCKHKFNNMQIYMLILFLLIVLCVSSGVFALCCSFFIR